jgi:L-ascorbate metabolism protein UlaG (beta-lactamase superfamily)
MLVVQTKQCDSPLAAQLAVCPADRVVRLWWLGQAGFAIRYCRWFGLIDPYLSDRLARKYAGTTRPHERMMSVPIGPNELRQVDAVLCTHRHGDHMDGDTLSAIAASNPHCRLVVPRALRKHALGLPLKEASMVLVDAHEVLSLADQIHVEALPAAHETLSVDDSGRHDCLGYIVRLGAVSLYHSGDCVPYDGLPDALRAARIDIALLPVNGRGIPGTPGNFTFAEAQDLCRRAGIRTLVPHHFGMFSFNTLSDAELDSAIATCGAGGVRVVRPQIGQVMEFSQVHR